MDISPLLVSPFDYRMETTDVTEAGTSRFLSQSLIGDLEEGRQILALEIRLF